MIILQPANLIPSERKSYTRQYVSLTPFGCGVPGYRVVMAKAGRLVLDPRSAVALALPRGAGGLAMACPHALPRALPVGAWTGALRQR